VIGAVEVAGTLSIFGAAPTPATLTLVPLSPGRRLVRALVALSVCWVAAGLAVFIPVAHFVLVPALAIAGVVGFVIRVRERQRFLRVHGMCPRCGREQDFVPGGSMGGRPTVDCPACFNRLLVGGRDGGTLG
jgi:DNA-directed RNA polymerase subunit RPC12/RpoP